ncbi:MAG: hypothetical protein LBI42_14540 [Chitinispirillales bacterium]|nr:hypothetical protein [Chitinispirillales bacterium]
MKPKQILSGLTVLWVFVIILEGMSALIRAPYNRKMNAAFKTANGAVSYGKTLFMIILAVSNVILFLRHIDER